MASNLDETEKCWIDWVEDGVLGCTYNHTIGAECLMDRCEYCQLSKCKCYDEET